jgi:BioD-like phosphotransacetylase family protein
VDEVILNRAVFEKEGVPIAGVIVNKIIPDKLENIRGYLSKSLQYHGLKLLGVMPEIKQLSRLTLRQVARDIGAEVAVGEQYLDNTVERFIVGAMTAHKALDYLVPGVLMITGGDRDDLVLAAVGMCFVNPSPEIALAGVILTGGMAPHSTIHQLLKHACFPVLLHEDDSFSVATMVNNLVAKIQIQDKVKHRAAIEMVRQYVDIDGLFAML